MKGKPYHIRGTFKILCFSLTGRPIYVTQGVYKSMIEKEGGRLCLVGNPVGVGLDFNVDLTETPVWKGKAVNKLIELCNYPITSLAPGIVTVSGLRSPFLFYGNCWFQLAHTHLVNDELVMTDEVLANREEDGQLRFTAAMDKMEQATALNSKPILHLKK